MLVFRNFAKNWSSISGNYAAVSLKKMASWLSHSLIEIIPLLISKIASSTSLKILTSSYKYTLVTNLALKFSTVYLVTMRLSTSIITSTAYGFLLS